MDAAQRTTRQVAEFVRHTDLATVPASAIVGAKLNHAPPDLVVRPHVGIFRTLDFYLASAIIRAAEPARAEIKERLVTLLAE